MKKLLLWLDHRVGYKKLLHEALYERIPGGARWRYVWGSTLVFTFVLQMITGIFLWAAYSPSAQTAWESVYFIQEEMTLGWLVRGMHHFAAQAMIVLLALHLIQVVIDGAYRAPREVNFWLGLILMQIILGLSLTGYLLPWDQKGYYATKVSTKILGATPLIGTQLQKLVQGGPEYGHHTLTRFFAMHTGILPGLLIFFLVLHLALFRRHGVHPKKDDPAKTTTFFPDQVLRDGVACLVVLAVVMLLAVFKGAELSAPANPSEAYSAARPEWYFLALFQFLRFEWVEHFGLAFGAIYVPGLIMLIVFLMPLIGRKEKGHKFNVCFIWTLFAAAVVLTAWAWIYDNYFDASYIAATEEADRDARRVKELAQGPERIPVEGAASLLKNDPFTQGPRLFAKHCSSCHRYNGHDGTGRMVYELIKDDENDEGTKYLARPTAADLGNLGTREWFRSLLLKYEEHFAPLKNAAWYQKYAPVRKEHNELKARLEQLNGAVGKGKPDAKQTEEIREISRKILKLAGRVRSGALSQSLTTERENLEQLRIEQANAQQAMKELLRYIDPESESGAKVKQQLSAEVDKYKERIEKTEKAVADLEAKLKALNESPNHPEALEPEMRSASGEIAKVESQSVILGTLVEAYLDPTPGVSQMAMWWSGGDADEDARKALHSEKNQDDLDALIEFLVSQNGRPDLDVDETKALRGKEIFDAGMAEGTVWGCTYCHPAMRETGDYEPTSGISGPPDLMRIYSAKWLKDFISHPARSQHYGVANRMPGFADRLSDHELDLLVRWMVRDYYPTKIPPHESRLEELEAGLKERPDAPKESDEESD